MTDTHTCVSLPRTPLCVTQLGRQERGKRRKREERGEREGESEGERGGTGMTQAGGEWDSEGDTASVTHSLQ